MRTIWPPNGPQGYWLTPAVVGVLLMLAGLLIYVEPRLLAYFVAGVFVVAGAALVAIAWRMRGRVSYRRIDETPHSDDEAHER
jgi:uncharacterized membrane protein HdeD (DUF308 family)